mgnify:CR=1 FL=1
MNEENPWQTKSSQKIYENPWISLTEHQVINPSGGDGIYQDTSIEDVLQSIAGLSKGDGVLAGEGYSKVISRWRQIATFEQAQ